jgi:CheY-like chemotaxis protein
MKNILIAEDEEDLVIILGAVLKDEGYNVLTSSSAEEALQRCETSCPDLILCDVRMGEMDGFTLLEKLKAIEKFRNIPFIFLTSFDTADAKKKGMKLGASAYITKPFDVDFLLETMRKLAPPTDVA